MPTRRPIRNPILHEQHRQSPANQEWRPDKARVRCVVSIAFVQCAFRCVCNILGCSKAGFSKFKMDEFLSLEFHRQCFLGHDPARKSSYFLHATSNVVEVRTADLWQILLIVHDGHPDLSLFLARFCVYRVIFSCILRIDLSTDLGG